MEKLGNIEYIWIAIALISTAIILNALTISYPLSKVTGELVSSINQPIDKFVCAPVEPAIVFGAKVDREKASQVLSLLERKTVELMEKLKDYKTKPTKAKLQQLQNIANVRKKALIETMRSDPDAALRYVLKEQERNDFAIISTNCIEAKSVMKGKLGVVHTDHFDEGFDVNDFTLATGDNRLIQLHQSKGDLASIPPGSEIKINNGYLIEGNLLFEGALSQDAPTSIIQDLEIVSAAQAYRTVGEFKTIVVLLNFLDNFPQRSTPTPSTVANTLDTVSNFYRENSYQKAIFKGVQNPTRGADVFGWYQINANIADSCQLSIIKTLALDAVKANNPGVDTSVYNKVILVYPTMEASCFGGFGGARGVPEFQMVVINPTLATGAATQSHELGHTFGLGHANFMYCDIVGLNDISIDKRCPIIEYADRYDTMGGACLLHFNSVLKDFLGWYDASTVTEVKGAGEHIFTIVPLEDPSTSALHSVKIRRAIDDYLYVAYRQPIGFDAAISNCVGDEVIFEGASFHIIDTRGRSLFASVGIDPVPPTSNLGPVLRVGESFTDPATAHRVEILSKTDGASGNLVVKVTMTDVEFDPPSVTITSPVFGQAVSGTLQVLAEVTDDSPIDRVEFLFDGFATPFAAATSPIAGNTYQGSLDTRQLHNGAWVIVAKAYDIHGNVGTSIRVDFVVANTDDRIPPSIAITSPLPGSTVDTTFIPVVVETSDNTGIWKVEFYIDYDTFAFPVQAVAANLLPLPSPVSTTIPSFSTGPHPFMARAYDLQGNTKDSSWVPIDVVNDVDITSPRPYFITPDRNDFRAIISGNIQVEVVAHDNVATQRVDFFVRDFFGARTGPIPATQTGPFTFGFDWDSSSVNNGFTSIDAMAYDAAGNQGFGSVWFEVNNIVPTVSLIEPLDGTIVSGSNVFISATASFNNPILQVDFYLDTLTIGTVSSAPYAISWNSATVDNGAHTLRARGCDVAGRCAFSDEIIIIVDNAGGGTGGGGKQKII